MPMSKSKGFKRAKSSKEKVYYKAAEASEGFYTVVQVRNDVKGLYILHPSFPFILHTAKTLQSNTALPLDNTGFDNSELPIIIANCLNKLNNRADVGMVMQDDSIERAVVVTTSLKGALHMLEYFFSDRPSTLSIRQLNNCHTTIHYEPLL